MYWALCCCGALLLSLAAAGLLEASHGSSPVARAVSRVVSGPAYCLDQYVYRLDGVIWEEIMLYSAFQWVVLWLVGCLLLALIRRVSVAALACGTLLVVALLGFCVARAPSDPMQTLFRIHQFDRAIDRQLDSP